MSFRILYQDEFLVAIDKPAGFHVHPPEDTNHSISRSVNCLHLLRNQLGLYLYPVHRLDRATSGVLLFALNSSVASTLGRAFQQHHVKKTYFCVTRGWTEEAATIEHALRSDDAEARPQAACIDEIPRKDALTSFRRLAKVELPHAVGRYPSARYSLLQVEPRSGRKHQIRRHLNHVSHPLIGDSIYGNGEHNRFFRDQLKIQGLLLKAYSIEITHPQTGELLRITSRWNGLWHRVFDLFGVCPWVNDPTMQLDLK